MAKHLLIMRHAKSSWADSNATDHERTLNRRGLRDAPRMAQFVASQDCRPDFIASSTAQRAASTASLFAENCPGSTEIPLHLVAEFYHASPQAYLDYIGSIRNEGIGTLMVVGHNPGLESLVYRLSKRHERMPTAAVAHFRLDIDCWSKVNDSFRRAPRRLAAKRVADVDVGLAPCPSRNVSQGPEGWADLQPKEARRLLGWKSNSFLLAANRYQRKNKFGTNQGPTIDS